MPNESLALLLFCIIALLLAIVLALVVIILRFADVGAAWRTLRAALPGRRGSFEKAYLRAIVNRLGTTPALLVIGSSSDTSRRDLRLLEAFSPLTLRPDSNDAASAQVSTPGAAIQAHPRLLIRGDPGSGKTTLLRHIAVLSARDRLGEARRWRGDRVGDVYGWPGRPPFPIYMPLRALSTTDIQTQQPLPASYAAILVSILGPDVQGCPRDFFVRRLQRGGCLLLLDAFDELRSTEDRVQLGRLVAALPPGPARNPNRIVVTSRIVGYEGQLDEAGFVQRLVEELGTRQAKSFIRARYIAIAATERRALGLPDDTPLSWNPEERAGVLITRLPTNPGLRRLSRNPLLLSLTVALHHHQRGKGQQLPQERYRLYEEALKLLVYDWERRKDADIGLEPTDSRSDLNLDEKLRLLRELAWSMFEQAPADRDSRAHAVITGTQVRDKLAQTLEQIPGFAPDYTGAARTAHARSEAARWQQNLTQRGGVLQELGNVPGSSEVEIQFAHLTFQEYLAARAAAGEQPERRRQRLLEQWDDPRWREVLLLYAAGHDANPVVQHLLAQDTPAGQVLAGAVILERPIKLEQANYIRTLEALRRLARDDQADVASGLALFQMLYDAGGIEQVRPDPAGDTAEDQAFRNRLMTLLNGAEPYHPAPKPAVPAVQKLARRVLEVEPDYRLRLAAGFALARDDPRYDDEGWMPEMVEIPAGPFRMGSNDADRDARNDEKPQHEIDLPTYFIGRTPVTNAQWRRFVVQDGYTNRDYWTESGWEWREREKIRQPDYWDNPKFNGDNQPVVGISWYEAVAYCRWLSDVTGQAFYLPSEAEWEKAARGPDGRIYPWGNDWQPGYCNSEELGLGRTAPVGSFPAGAGPYGALDMVGNIWEWCATKWGKKYPYKLEQEWHVRYLDGTNNRVIRGSSWYNDRTRVRCASRYFIINPHNRDNNIGLRVASRSPQRRSDG